MERWTSKGSSLLLLGVGFFDLFSEALRNGRGRVDVGGVGAVRTSTVRVQEALSRLGSQRVVIPVPPETAKDQADGGSDAGDLEERHGLRMHDT